MAGERRGDERAVGLPGGVELFPVSCRCVCDGKSSGWKRTIGLEARLGGVGCRENYL